MRLGNYKHGDNDTRLYRIWKGMRARCNCSSNHKYPRYGGRGITICQDWNDFLVFKDWAIRSGYDDTLSIDRIDNDGNYEPNNCRWATSKEQSNNRGYRVDTTIITKDGETHSLIEWSEILGIKYKTLIERKRRGYTVEDLLQPVNKRRKKYES